MMCFEYVEAVCWYVVIVIVLTSSNNWEFHFFRSFLEFSLIMVAFFGYWNFGIS